MYLHNYKNYKAALGTPSEASNLITITDLAEARESRAASGKNGASGKKPGRQTKRMCGGSHRLRLFTIHVILRSMAVRRALPSMSLIYKRGHCFVFGPHVGNCPSLGDRDARSAAGEPITGCILQSEQAVLPNVANTTRPLAPSITAGPNASM